MGRMSELAAERDALPQPGEGDMPEQQRRIKHAKRCIDCLTNWADPPSKLCPGCQAYRDHTGAI